MGASEWAFGGGFGLPREGLGGWTRRGAGYGSVGGLPVVLQGGRFGHSPVASSLRDCLSGSAGDALGRPVAPPRPWWVSLRSALGGTFSSQSGGKFSNGAATVAAEALFNGHPARAGALEPGRRALILFIEREALARVEIGLSEGFDTQDEAAWFLHDRLYDLSVEHQVEIGARIYNREYRGRWYVTAPNTDGLPNEVTRAPVPQDAYGGTAGVWHSHPNGTPPGPFDSDFRGARFRSLYVSHMEDGIPVLSEYDHLLADKRWRIIPTEEGGRP